MAVDSSLPASRDTFTTKVDSVDVVKADDMNKVQNVLVALEDATLFSGTGMVYTKVDPANTYLVDGMSLKRALESVDGAAGINKKGLSDHKTSTGAGGVYEHNASAISVNPSANLLSTSVQAALAELQGDINNIMIGGTVNNVSLDTRYLLASGAVSDITGDLNVGGSLSVSGQTTIGDDATDIFIVKGPAYFESDSFFSKLASFDLDIKLKNATQLYFETFDNYIKHYPVGDPKEGIEIATSESLTVILDSDRLFFPSGQGESKFVIRDTSNVEQFSVDKDGFIFAKGGITVTGATSGEGIISSGALVIGPNKEVKISTEILAPAVEPFMISSTKNKVYLLKLNTTDPYLVGDPPSTGVKFVITDNDYDGSGLIDQRTLFTLDGSSTITSGIHVLKAGVTETGLFGLKAYSSSGAGAYYGAAINFKYSRAVAPSFSSFTIPVSVPGDPWAPVNVNLGSLAVTYTTKDGMFFEFNTTATGPASIMGTYTIS